VPAAAPSASPAEATIAGAARGDRRSLARAVSLVEADAPGAARALDRLPIRRMQAPGAPHVVGVTGPPGAGKSTFVDRLVTTWRQRGWRVAVVAVDPSSPFSGGAILGDRVRMERHAADPMVYVRSLGSRGQLGGLGRATAEVVDLLDGCGFDGILVETVGVGQGELGVMQVADTVLVVLTPESGDSVQAMKAGLLEIADVFVVNKSDRPGAEALCRELRLTVDLDGQAAWKAPVLAASAAEGRGIDEVVAALAAHREHLAGGGRAAWSERRADGRRAACLDRVAERARAEAARALAGTDLESRLRAGHVRAAEAAEALTTGAFR
jgi:LAO/AO transport system kinase